MKIYRCKVCGYLHVGSAPEECPMCHAGQAAFVEYQPADVTGTKTAENLAAAFAGESQANRKYTLWKRIAEEAGEDAAAAAFDRPMAEETAHALAEAVYLGMFGGVKENLESAAAGEQYEEESMYPEFAKIAREEGFEDIAHFFEMTAKFEGAHKAGYKKAAEAL